MREKQNLPPRNLSLIQRFDQRFRPFFMPLPVPPTRARARLNFRELREQLESIERDSDTEMLMEVLDELELAENSSRILLPRPRLHSLIPQLRMHPARESMAESDDEEEASD